MDSFGIYLLALGLVISGHGGYEIVVGYRSLRWPAASGQVVRSTVDERGDTRSVDVLVAYAIDGQTFQRTETVPLGGFPTDQNIDRALLRHPPGRPIAVRYDPTRPQRSRLRPGVRAANGAELVIGLAIMLGGIVQIVSTRSG